MEKSSDDEDFKSIENSSIPDFLDHDTADDSSIKSFSSARHLNQKYGVEEEDDDDDDSNSGSSESIRRPRFVRNRSESSGSDSDYHRYMKSNFITEVYHAKDYDYSTNDEEDSGSNIMLSSRSSSFASLSRESMDSSTASDVADSKGDVKDTNTSTSGGSSERQRNNKVINREDIFVINTSTTATTSLVIGGGKKSVTDADNHDNDNNDNCVHVDPEREVKEDTSSSDSTDSSHHRHREKINNNNNKIKKREKFSESSQYQANDSQSLAAHQTSSLSPTKPAKPIKRSSSIEQQKHQSQLSVEINELNDTFNNNNDNNFSEISITVTSPERDLVTYGTEAATYYLDGSNKCLISSATAFTASSTPDYEDMFNPKFIPLPKNNAKSLSWHISITDNVVRKNGYQLSIYKVLLRRSKSWFRANNWALFIDGKHVANGSVPFFTMSSEICFEMPTSIAQEKNETVRVKQQAKIEIKRTAWYRRKLLYTFKIGGNVYPTYYAQPVDLVNFLSSTPEPESETEQEVVVLQDNSDQEIIKSSQSPTTTSSSEIESLTTTAIVTTTTSLSSTNSPITTTPSTTTTTTSPITSIESTDPSTNIVTNTSTSPTTSTPASTPTSTVPTTIKRNSASSTITKAISSTASTLKSSTSTQQKSKSMTRVFSPAQMVITIPSTKIEVTSAGKSKVYYQILIRIPAMPQPMVVERRYKHFEQLCKLLRGELKLTLEHSMQMNVDKENIAVQIKLNQFPSLPARVYNPMVNQLRPEFLKDRRVALQSFLIELMSYDQKIVHSSEFLGFLGLHPITCSPMITL